MEPCIQISGFFLNFGQILGIENLESHLILVLLIELFGCI
jgi:hypothetical protein